MVVDGVAASIFGLRGLILCSYVVALVLVVYGREVAIDGLALKAPREQ